jgi:microcystin-dependent protein
VDSGNGGSRDLEFLARKQHRRISQAVDAKVSRTDLTWEEVYAVDDEAGLIELERWPGEWLPVMNQLMPEVGQVVLVGMANGGPVVFGPPPETPTAYPIAPDDPEDASLGTTYRVVNDDGSEDLVVVVLDGAANQVYRLITGETGWYAKLLLQFTPSGTTSGNHRTTTDRQGNLVMQIPEAAAGAGNIHRYSPGGELITSFGTTATATTGIDYRGMAVNDDNNLALLDTGQASVPGGPQGWLYTMAGSYTGTSVSSTGTAVGQVQIPVDLAVAPNQDTYILHWSSVGGTFWYLVRIDGDSGIATRVTLPGGATYTCVAADAGGNIYVGAAGTPTRWLVYDTTLTLLYTQDLGLFGGVVDLDVEPDGTLYVITEPHTFLGELPVYRGAVQIGTIPVGQHLAVGEEPAHLSLTTGRLYLTANGAGQTYVYEIPSQGITGPVGPRGPQGVGAPVAIAYQFDTATSNVDPGAGKMRLNQATQNTSNLVHLDLASYYGVDVTSLLDSFDAPTSLVKGHLRIEAQSDPLRHMVLAVTDWDAPSGYRTGTVSVLSSSAASPFVNGELLQVTFVRTGDKGDQGIPGAPGSGATPPGVIAMWSAPTPPADWLVCNGQEVSRTTYAALYATVGDRFGAGDGSTTFKVPDLRGRFAIGRSTTPGTVDPRFDDIGEVGGSYAETLTAAQSGVPGHAHGPGNLFTDTAPNHQHQGDGGGSSVQRSTGAPAAATGSASAALTGGGGAHWHWLAGGATGTNATADAAEAHNNLPPFLTLDFIIKT